MTLSEKATQHSVVVIGAGQAGLATGYYLQAAGVDFTILADDERVGDPWRQRWDSLVLFTPAFYNGLPGLDFPAEDPEYLPHKDEMATYLETYADRFYLPIELDIRVTRLRHENGQFLLETPGRQRYADEVVVATGAHSTPWLPPFAEDLPDDVFACHSSEYQNPAQLQAGDVLVAGAGNSGTQIAAELGEQGDRTVWLAGPDTGRLPRRLLGQDIYRWIGPTLLKISRYNVIGRRLHERIAHSGDPVFSDQFDRMQAAGVERVDRVTGIVNGQPVTGDGQAFEVANVVWATGFQPRYPWIDLDIFEASGEPRHTRGVVEEAPGLYFVGLRWQTRASSSLTGGVGPDAKHVADRIETRAT